MPELEYRNSTIYSADSFPEQLEAKETAQPQINSSESKVFEENFRNIYREDSIRPINEWQHKVKKVMLSYLRQNLLVTSHKIASQLAVRLVR